MAFGDCGCPAGGRRNAAESEEVWLDHAETAIGAGLCECLDKRVRGRHGEQLSCKAGLARKPLDRGAHAAAAGITQQSREVGWARKPCAHRMLQTEVAQPPDPLQDGGGI